MTGISEAKHHLQALRLYLIQLTQGERMDLWPDIRSALQDYCDHCGADIPCHCENDE